MLIKTHKMHFDEPLHLESGRILPSYDLVYETYGELNQNKDNVIVVCHALTGSHHAAGRYENDNKTGWWDSVIGDGKAINTEEFFVICINILGSSFGSTNPMSLDSSTGKEYRLNFPVLTISDIVKAQIRLFNKLGIYSVHAVIGGSLGGMQALCFAIEFPKFAKKIIMLATTYATMPWAIAFNKIAIEGIMKDPSFKNGNYDPCEIKKNGLLGMALARMAGHISFLSPSSMDAKFGRDYVQTDGLYDLKGRYEVDKYLDYNGYNFSKRFDPLSYIYIAKMMNNFDCTRHYDNIEDAFSYIEAKCTLIAFSTDLLFPSYLMARMRDAFYNNARKELCKYICIDSDYGHDAFLVDCDKFDFYIKRAIYE